jgi:hypothetical protein
MGWQALVKHKSKIEEEQHLEDYLVYQLVLHLFNNKDIRAKNSSDKNW